MKSRSPSPALALALSPWSRAVIRSRTILGLGFQWIRHSIWLPVVARGVVALVAFAALAYVGQGARRELQRERFEPPPIAKESSPSSPSSASQPATAAVALCASAKAPSAAWTADGRLILNRGTIEDFIKLPGVGRKRAEAIVKLRARLRRFRRIQDLLRVRGIGYRSLKRLKPLVVVDAPTTPPPSPSASAVPAPKAHTH